MGNLRFCCMFEWKFRHKIDFDLKKNMKHNKAVKLGIIQMYPGFAKILSKLYPHRK